MCRVYLIAYPDLFYMYMTIYFDMYTHIEHTRLRIKICFLYVYKYCVLYVYTSRVCQIVHPDLFYMCMNIYFNMYTHIEHTRLLYLYTWNYSISNCISRAIFCGWRRSSWKIVRFYVQIFCTTHSYFVDSRFYMYKYVLAYARGEAVGKWYEYMYKHVTYTR